MKFLNNAKIILYCYSLALLMIIYKHAFSSPNFYVNFLVLTCVVEKSTLYFKSTEIFRRLQIFDNKESL